MNETVRDELNLVSMQIILHAGDAKIKVEEALDKMKDFDFDLARQLLKHADDDIVLAHQAQTEIIQSEAAGKEYPNSLLFNHAQDTMMIAMNDLDMAKKFLSILEAIAARIVHQ